MTKADEDPLQSIWKAQPILSVSLTPEEMRARAAQFETETRRRNRVDSVSFALVAVFFAIGALTVEGVLVRAGALLLAVWAFNGLYSVRRFHELTAQRSTESTNSCAAWYQQQLERQRDVALSRPWGIALALPGFALLLAGYIDNGVPWRASVLLAGLGLFSALAVVIHGRLLAGRWQEEIKSLQNLRSH
jgi:hypothetical protein